MSLCKTIDTLAMAYLDDELAAEERHELEAHLTECAGCRGTLERERADRSMIRRALAVPATPDLLRAKISRGLDEADRAESKAQRRRLSSYLLPSSAIAAAAAAIALFIGGQAPHSSRKVTGVAVDTVKQTSRSLPLEVQGASTGPWLQQHFAEDVQEPDLQENDSLLLGARLLPGGINGHDAAMTKWQVRLPGQAPVQLFVVMVNGLGDDEMRDGTPVRVNNRTLFVFETKDQYGHTQPVVSYVGPNRLGFMFVAPELSANDLISLASRVNLVAPQ